MAYVCMLQSEEEGLKVKQEETGETVQLPDQAGRATAEAATSLVVPVQNGEGDSLNLSAGFIQVHILLRNYCVDSNDKGHFFLGWDFHMFRPVLIHTQSLCACPDVFQCLVAY